jgi:outer membrane protein assembly factor BamB
LSDRIVSAPVSLPDNKGVVVADIAGTLTLLEPTANGGLSEKRKWPNLGTITAGPFVEKMGDSVRIVCVCGSKLVWIDPDSDKEKWTFQTEKEVDIVGRPRIASGLVIVADHSGRYLGIDPETGKSGRAYRLTGSIAPASGAVGFHDDRLMAPLSDGTLLLVGLKRLKEK